MDQAEGNIKHFYGAGGYKKKSRESRKSKKSRKSRKSKKRSRKSRKNKKSRNNKSKTKRKKRTMRGGMMRRVHDPLEEDIKEEDLRCPITHEFMLDPVKNKDGHTFEREAIEKWLESSDKSPITRNAMSIRDLVPNTQIKNIIKKRGYLKEARTAAAARAEDSAAAYERSDRLSLNATDEERLAAAEERLAVAEERLAAEEQRLAEERLVVAEERLAAAVEQQRAQILADVGGGGGGGGGGGPESDLHGHGRGRGRDRGGGGGGCFGCGGL
jgi:hypothetical protein